MTAGSQMACCKSGHRECGTQAAHECCKTDSQKQQQFVIVAKHELVKSPLTALEQVRVVFPGDLVTISPTLALLTDLRVVSKSPPTPTYLLVSALLI